MPNPGAVDVVDETRVGLVGRNTFIVRPREAFDPAVAALESSLESRLQDPQGPVPGALG